ncbi:MAG: TlyA family RNA methyltransferase [Sphingomonadales bacterium]|nr:TlyA family RNA methyltransferase [Sphingomonadales bacterium]
MPKIRADQAVVEQGFADSRSKAQAMILAGIVYLDTRKIEKSGQTISGDAKLEVKGKTHPWVSRGGIKLAHGLECFNISAKDSIVLDVGASTGGFSDVALNDGAVKVYAVDVGHGQLDWKLRNDPRVVVLERTNARYLDKKAIPDPIDLIVCDASFISLKTVLPAAMKLAKDGAHLIALIKPQFEVGKDQVGKKGVVRDPELHKAVVDDISNWLANMAGWRVLGVDKSPITGPEGNVEFLICGQYAESDENE